MNRVTMAAGALAALLWTAGCSKQQPTEAVTDNAAETAPAPQAPPPPVETPPPAPAVTPPPPADPVEPDAQILDDADATGMTARLPRAGTEPDEAEPATADAP